MYSSSPKDLYKLDRPREKLVHKGAAALSDHELLMVILGSGIKDKSVSVIANQVLKLFKHSGKLPEYKELNNISGISLAKISTLMASWELVSRYIHDKAPKVLKPKDVLPLVGDIRYKKQEHLICISLSGNHTVLATRLVTIGTLSSTLVHPREVFADAISDRAAGVVLVHNHPSGDCRPSEEDIAVTKSLIDAGRLLGIEVYDHVVVHGNEVNSILFDKLD